METPSNNGQPNQPNKVVRISQIIADGYEIVAGDEHSIRTKGEWLRRGIGLKLRSAQKACKTWAKENGRCCFSISPNGETFRFEPNGSCKKIKKPYFLQVGA